MSDEGTPARTAPRADIAGRRDLPGREPRVKLYDFRRPDKFSKEQIRTMQFLGETFARLAETGLSATLRLPCELHVEMVDQLTYEEFCRSIEGPCALAVMSMQPLKGQIVLHLDAPACDAVIDRLFGAFPKATDAPLALGGITDIEFVALERPLSQLGEFLGEAWAQVERVEPKLMQVETEPRFCQIVPPNEMIVLTTFSISVGGVKGYLNIVYPFLVLEPVIGKLSAKYWFARARGGCPESAAMAYAARLPAELVCRTEAASVAFYRGLKKGSVVALPGLDEGRAELRLGGARVAGLQGLSRDGKGYTAAFSGEDAVASALVAKLFGDGAKPEGASMAEELKAGLGELRAGMEAALGRLAGEVESMRHGQEDLSDRVFFGQADAGAQGPKSRPFASIAAVEAELLAMFLANERPQVCALVLSFLDDAPASRTFTLLPEERQADIARRIGSMDSASPETLAEAERVLAKKLSTIDKAGLKAGGVDKLIGMLNLVPRATEKLVIQSLDSSEPELAEAIKRGMFVFEDISILDDESISSVFGRASERDILVAMKPVSDELRERLFLRFPADKRERLRAEYAALGRMRLRDCDEAGARVVAVIRSLEEEGRIVILRDDERL